MSRYTSTDDGYECPFCGAEYDDLTDLHPRRGCTTTVDCDECGSELLLEFEYSVSVSATVTKEGTLDKDYEEEGA
jgi:hypothetical protein